MSKKANTEAVIGFSVLIGLVLLALAFVVFVHKQPTVSGNLDSVSTSTAPWPAETAHLRERLSAIGLPALSNEGTALHIHQHLDIFIHGTTTPVPEGIGIHEADGANFIASIHVHDTTGIVHVESPTVQTFTLGQFFDIWGVRLSSTCIGGYCSDGTNTFKLYVNGMLYADDPRKLELASHQEIVITYGTDAEVPKTIPSTYAFPDGY